MRTEKLGPLEQKVMNVLWISDTPLKPQEVLEKLKGDYAYTTIMTILKRLVDKNIASRQLSGKVYLYTTCQCKKDFVKENLSSIYKDLVDSYHELAISQFVDTLKKDKTDLQFLKNYLK
jgi:predicted transcriptional regulator